VNSVTVITPGSATSNVSFVVTGITTVHNNGPTPSVMADVRFTLNLPPDCTASSSTTATVLNRTLSMSVPVSVSRSWNVTCTQAGAHQSSQTPVFFSAGQTGNRPQPGEQ
jgi:hypothetical protein